MESVKPSFHEEGDAKVPDEPLDPSDPRVDFMRASEGPFKCANCHFYNGPGKNCDWVKVPLQNGDCCNKFRKHHGN